jgi:hypothetical protein
MSARPDASRAEKKAARAHTFMFEKYRRDIIISNQGRPQPWFMYSKEPQFRKDYSK